MQNDLASVALYIYARYFGPKTIKPWICYDLNKKYKKHYCMADS